MFFFFLKFLYFFFSFKISLFLIGGDKCFVCKKKVGQRGGILCDDCYGMFQIVFLNGLILDEGCVVIVYVKCLYFVLKNCVGVKRELLNVKNCF